MKWISIKDRFPEEKDSVHLITDGKRVAYSEWTYWPPYSWNLPHGMEKVTHWMPLPEPPKQSEIE